MPRRPASKPAVRTVTLASVSKSNAGDRVDLPEHFLTNYLKGSEALHAGWWKQLRELSADELRVLAFHALTSIQTLEAQRFELRSEIERRDELRTRRGKAAQLPAVQQFKARVKTEWELVRDAKSRGALTNFARKVISRKGAPITDAKTVLRWCREWEAERERLATRPVPRFESDGTPRENVYDQVGLAPDPIPFDDNWDPNTPPKFWQIKRF